MTKISTRKIDVHALLERRRQVAIIWSTEDVQEVRPHLTRRQAWKVLQACKENHDCNCGITWMSLEMTADDLFPSTTTEEFWP